MKSLDQVILKAEELRKARDRGELLGQANYALSLIFDLLEAADLKKGEPVFVLRGQDAAAPASITNYRSTAAHVGSRIDFQQSVDKRAEEFYEWQRLNPELVKVPD
jgi:hypothetical protein